MSKFQPEAWSLWPTGLLVGLLLIFSILCWNGVPQVTFFSLPLIYILRTNIKNKFDSN